jgi:hypothetical protein
VNTDRTAWRYYFLFFALQLFFLVFAYFFYLETKGMTMEEVGNLFGRLLPLLPSRSVRKIC